MKVAIVSIFALFAFGFVLSIESNIDMSKVLRDARDSIEQDIKDGVMAGAQSKKPVHKKFTKISRLMDSRNALHRKARSILISHGVTQEEANNLINGQLKLEGLEKRSTEEKLKMKKFRVSGQASLALNISLISDLCEETVPNCDMNDMFRTITGQCNNLEEGRQLWGSMTIKMRRLLPQVEGDLTKLPVHDELISRTPPSTKYFGVPVGKCSECCPKSECAHSIKNISIPNPRLVSTAFHGDTNIPDTKATHMVTQFGQMVDHDMSLVPESEEHECCHDSSSPDCLPIRIPKNDPFYSKLTVPQTCLEFTRSTSFCESGMTHKREQMNGITSFLDASHVYGSEPETAKKLRGSNGDMLLDDNLLPKDDEGFRIAGDSRAREMPGLASMHTLFVREHNRIAKDLRERFAQTNDELIYQNAKRIVAAIWQSIIYKELLPIILGNHTVNKFGLNLKPGSDYSKNFDPSITNSFATAAFRFGHSMIQGFVKQFALDSFSNPKTFELSKHFFNLEKYEADNGRGMDEIIQGLVLQPAQMNDRHITSQVTNHLFPEDDDAAFGQDLVARNIQRGRDHGLPSYAAFALHFNKELNLDCWSKRPETITKEKWEKLSKIYQHPHHIDLFAGGLAETPVKGGLSGPVFNKIKAEQFKQLMYGDRFFFTHQNQKGSFTIQAQEEIMKRGLAEVICDNTEIKKMPKNPFLIKSNENVMTDCSERRQFNLKAINLIENQAWTQGGQKDLGPF